MKMVANPDMNLADLMDIARAIMRDGTMDTTTDIEKATTPAAMKLDNCYEYLI